MLYVGTELNSALYNVCTNKFNLLLKNHSFRRNDVTKTRSYEYNTICNFVFLDLDLATSRIVGIPKNAKIKVGDNYKDKLQRVKPGKILPKLVQKSMNNELLSRVCDELAKEMSSMSTRVDDIFETTEFGRYYDCGGVDSCMASKPHHWFDLYVDAGATLAILPGEHEEHINSRAVIWHKVRKVGSDETFSVFSSIYQSSGGNHSSVMREYCLRKGYIDLYEEQGKDKQAYYVPFEYRPYDAVPYIDAFAAYDVKRACLHSYSPVFMCNTSVGDTNGEDEGEIFTDGGIYCSKCGETVDDPDDGLYCDEVFCEECRPTNIVKCVVCEGLLIDSHENKKRVKGEPNPIPLCLRCRHLESTCRLQDCRNTILDGSEITIDGQEFCGLPCALNHLEKLISDDIRHRIRYWSRCARSFGYGFSYVEEQNLQMKLKDNMKVDYKDRFDNYKLQAGVSNDKQTNEPVGSDSTESI